MMTREELSDVVYAIPGLTGGHVLSEKCDIILAHDAEQRAEIERLKHQLEEYAGVDDLLVKQGAEIARLRNLTTTQGGSIRGLQDLVNRRNDELDRRH